MKNGAQSINILDVRWVLTKKEADGVKTVKARLVARGYRDPDLHNGDMDIAGCVSRKCSGNVDVARWQSLICS